MQARRPLLLAIMKWYVWTCSLLISFGGFMWGYEVGSLNGVKEMPDYRRTLNISYIHENRTDQCTSSDDVETGALLGGIVTVLHVGCFIGALFAGILSDLAGRKVAVITGAACCIVGGALHTGAVNVWMVFVGRVVSGLGIGVLLQVAPLYIAEIAPKKLRGRLIIFMGVSSLIGQLLGTIINTITVKFVFGWRITLSIQVLAASALALGTFLVPETPRWLVKKHRYSKALTILKRIYQDESQAQSDLEDIKSSLNNDSKAKFADTLKYLFHWDILKRLFLGFFLQFLGRFSGSVFIAYYSVTLFCRIGIDGLIASIALFSFVLASLFVGVALVDKVGRKPLLLVSGVAMCLVVASAATLILVFDLEHPPEEGFGQGEVVAGYVVVVLVITFQCILGFSIGIIPFILNSEIFPLEVRGISVAISSTGWWGGNIVVSEVSPVLLSSPVGAYGTFYIITAICVLILLYVLLLIPETKGRSLEEIDLLFKKPWYERAEVLYYLRCGFLFKRKSCTRRRNQAHNGVLAATAVSPAANGSAREEEEDKEQLLGSNSESMMDSVELLDIVGGTNREHSPSETVL